MKEPRSMTRVSLHVTKVRGLFVALILAGGLLAFPVNAWGQADVRINEVLLWPGYTGAELLPYGTQWVELYNSGAIDVDLTGWTISDSGGTALASLPAIALPSKAYLTIHWDAGTNDYDFSDSDGHHYLGVASVPFERNADECALYSGAPGVATIEDFIAWNVGAGYVPGAAHDFAVAAGIWASGAFFDPGFVAIANTLGRTFNGWDNNVAGDWMVYRWNEYIVVGYTQPANPVHLSPEKNLVITDTTPLFDWQDAATVDSYQLQVDDNADFSSPVIDVLTASSDYMAAAPLTTSGYYYRVRGYLAGSPSDWSAAWLFAVDATGASASPSPRGDPCPFRWQHKDTNMLCIWDPGWDARPGCAETGNHAWDIPHPNQAPPNNEPHCDNYCARASIAMLNARYGGDLSQDRISYHYFREINDRVAGPEGDLGHGQWMVGQDFIDSIGWALNGAAIAVHPAPAGGFTFQQLKDWYDTHGCFVTNLPGHVVVTNGYLDFSATNVDLEILYINDPARGADQRKIYKWQLGSAPQPGGITDNITYVFLQPAPPAVINGRMQEATVTTDSDGDGVVDFDEQMPREFHSSHTKKDTDKDEVEDKNDIRNYVFHDSYHAGHDNDALDFPDIDGDGLRAENDCDSDSKDAVSGDGDFDGGEDIDGDGHNVEAGETCMFDPADWLETVNVDKDAYLIGEPVYIVDWHGSRETHTYHANSSYFYELGLGCPDKANDTGLGHSGSFSTDAGGHANTSLVMYCLFPGQYYLTVDVLGDFSYSEPDNTDPQTCWYCLWPIWDCVYTTTPGTTFSPSDWTRDGETIGTTFPDGITPIPGVPTYDSTGTPAIPNDWHWSVTYPWNTTTITTHVSVTSFSQSEAVVVPIVCSPLFLTDLTLTIDTVADNYEIRDDLSTLIWTGPWSLYPNDIDPVLLFQPAGIVRQNFLGCDTCPGDMDGSGDVTIDDLPFFVQNLLVAFPNHCGDMNGDLKVNGGDIAGFIAAVLANDGAGTPCGSGGTLIPAGEDCWATSCGRSSFDFCDNPIPPDFFNPGSEPFVGNVYLQGASGPAGIDTRVQRLSDMVLPELLPAVATVPIEIVELSLTSCQPITVVTAGQPELWDVQVFLSEAVVPLGNMTVTKTHENGGVFDADFFVQPLFVFTQVGSPTNVRVLDTALIGMPPIEFHTVGDAPWVHVLQPTNPVLPCEPGTVFVPGVEENPPGGQQCSRPVGHSGPYAFHETLPPNGINVCQGGACCIGGFCQMTFDEIDCNLNFGGLYMGNGTTCEDADLDFIADVFETNRCCGGAWTGDPCATGTDPNDFDTDEDGVPDGVELDLGTDPCNAGG